MNSTRVGSFHCIPVDNQRQTHLTLLATLTALDTPAWLIMTNLNKADFQ